MGNKEMLVDLLSKTTKISKNSLQNVACTADKRYKTYEIPKRNSQEMRQIDQPSRLLKSLQKWIVDTIFKTFPIHSAATAYKTGANIRKNAEKHLGTKYTNRYDFENFFPSFTSKDVGNFLLSRRRDLIEKELSKADIDFICKIVCRYGRLTIGAPSSPWITNAMMYEFDVEFDSYCKKKNLIYTRYADDIFVSSYLPNALIGLDKKINQITANYKYLSLTLKKEKTAFLSKKYRRSITGLNITPSNNISIGRNKKREIKYLVYSFKNNCLNAQEIGRLKGLIAFVHSVEPNFIKCLESKYGNNIILRLLKNK